MSDDLLKNAEKVDVTAQEATEGDVQSFHNMMQGDAVSGGGRFDMEDRGFGSGIDQPNYQDPGLKERFDEPETRLTRGEAQAMNPQEPSQEQLSQDDQDWKKLYGQSENEKGEWRRRAQEAAERVERLEKQFETMQSQFQNPNYAQPAQPQQPQRVDWNQVRFLDKDGEDVVTADEINHVMRLAAQDLETIRIQQGQLAMQQMNAQKAAAGITPMVEQQLYQANPWLGNVPPEHRVQALVSLKQNIDAARAQQQAQQPQPQQQAPVQQAPPQVPQQVVQRPLYVESGTGRTSTETQIPLEQRIEQELAEAKARGGSKEMEKVFRKYYGVGRVNDWGPEYLIG